MSMVVPSIIDRPEARRQLWPLSVEAYHVLGEAGLIPEKTELLYGFVFHKMPKSPFHRFLVQQLLLALRAVLPQGLLLWSEQPLRCSDSEPEPDISVIRGEEKDFRNVHPTTAELVIEVSITSEDYDRSKASVYAQAGVKEFWIILTGAKKIEVYRDPIGDRYASLDIIEGDQLAKSKVIPNLGIRPSALLAE